MHTIPSPQQIAQYRDDGYVILRGAISPELVATVSEAIDGVVEQAAAGAYEDRFRWLDEAARVPEFISDLLGAEKYHAAFGRYLDEVAVPVAEGLLDQPVRCGWMMMLSAGGGLPYSIALHRDNSAVGVDDEKALLERLAGHSVYFQAALLPDSFLWVVPGSHRRLATETEVKASELGEDCTVVPGVVQIELEPGDVVFRHSNALHAGYNPEGQPRRTLVSGMWAEALPMLDIERQDYALLSAEDFVEQLPGKCRAAAERYLAAYTDQT